MKNKLLISEMCVEVQCDRNDKETQEMLVDIYPKTTNRILTSFKFSNHLLPELLHLLRGVDINDCEALPDTIKDRLDYELAIRSGVAELLTNGPKESRVVNSHLTLDLHQQLGLEIAGLCKRFAFFYDTRTGKTPMSLAIINEDIRINAKNKWLVVCPLILIETAWLEDSARFFPDMKVINGHASTKKKRLEALSQVGNVYVVNTESFASYVDYYNEMNFAGCILDESSCLKSFSSKQSKTILEFSRSVSRFYILSGSPAPNGAHEYYTQLKCIDYYGWHQSYSQFEKSYFVDISYNSNFKKLELRPDKRAELFKAIKKIALYVDKEDALETPGRDFIEITFDMPADLLEMYRTVKHKLSIELTTEGDVKVLTIKGIAVKLNKLNQLSSGFFIDTQVLKENKFFEENNKATHVFSNYRIDKLLEVLSYKECVGQQVLIWANYKCEFSMIKEALGDKCACVYGETSIEEKVTAIRRFKKGLVQYLVANPASADKGLTLTNAHICVYYSLNWSYELFKQSMDRIYGSIARQPNRCLYYILLPNKAIDGIIYHDVLGGKSDASYAVLDHLKEGAH